MSWAAAVVLIVLISAIAGVMRSRSRAGRHTINQDGGPAEPYASDREQELESELLELRERIKVLERIATDANSAEGRNAKAIADEIEKLRDS